MCHITTQKVLSFLLTYNKQKYMKPQSHQQEQFCQTKRKDNTNYK